MKVIKAPVLGFCMGVRRAVDLAVEEAKSNKNVYTLGPLIHNPKVLDDLEKLGVQIIEESQLSAPSSLPTAHCSLIIRAHGVSPSLEKKLRENGFASKEAFASNEAGASKETYRIIDATCPKVKANQLKTRELIRDEYFLFLAGESHHAEIEGLVGYAQTDGNNYSSSNCMIVSDSNEAKNAAAVLYEENASVKPALIGQTTISQDEYRKIADEIKNYFPELKIVNTICSATEERQEALREILTQVDAVIVAGGKESANTRRLFAIAKESGKPCALIENADDIPKEFFGYKTVGISAGASTPDSIVDEIERKFITFFS